MSSSSLLKVKFFFCLHVIAHFQAANALIKIPPNYTIPAVYVFGDSIVDTGNNNNLITNAKCNFPPYGKDFPGGRPTGRFSNGKVPSDLIGKEILTISSPDSTNISSFSADIPNRHHRLSFLPVEELGIKEFLPAYAEPNLQPQDLITGVCFASGGAGFDPLTSKLSTAFSLSDQLAMFREYTRKLEGIVGEERAKFIIANSFHLVVVGSNDITNTYFLSRVRQLHYDINSYTDFMVESASSFFKELYGLGARRVGVFGVPALGCVPSQRTLAGGLERACVKEYNSAAALFNAKLHASLNQLQPQLPNSRLVYVDVYNPLLDIIQNPFKYGFEVVDRGCCGTGKIEVTALCNKFVKTCPDVTKFVFWDSFHPTESAYKSLVTPIIRKYFNSFL